MAYNSDTKIKRKLLDIHESADLKNLKPRWFDESRDDQKLWNEGGLTFKHGDFTYGSNDFGWELDKPCEVNGLYSNTTPIIVAEGTLGINKGNTGSAQFARFSHSLGAALNGICAVTFQNFQGIYAGKPAYSQYDYILSTIETTKILKTPNLFIDYDSPELLIELLKAYDNEDKNKINKIINKIINISQKYADTRSKKKKFLLRNNINEYSIIKWEDLYNKNYQSNTKCYYKIMWCNIFSFTTADRNDHTYMGELLANSYLFPEFQSTFLLPNMRRADLLPILNSDKKELKILFNHPRIKLLTVDDIDFKNNQSLLSGINDIYKKVLKNKVKEMQKKLEKELLEAFLNGSVKLKL